MDDFSSKKGVTSSLNPLTEKSNLLGTKDTKQQHKNTVSERKEDTWTTETFQG
ncbi:13642_t:CDS:2 [Acaulospora colombiana]|uniref:13642_t:CDS:1 n=1 Tax=Acaulospora colombiana TaxID=27376 RepID=A0ACA9LR10_9GLOM|nr:13642_t:CDS:2 [Acaulospora colombiana]